MEKRTCIDRVYMRKVISEVRSLVDELSIEEALKFISTDLKIAPNCVETILTNLGYIYRMYDHICHTERLFKLIKYDQATCTNRLTINGVELLYRLVFNSVYQGMYKDKSRPITHYHPVIFDNDVQALAVYDDKKLIQIDVALYDIYKKVVRKYGCINIGTPMYRSMLENANRFKFDEDGNVVSWSGIECYTYYIYDAKNVDEFNVVNNLSINSIEIYISKETYDKLVPMIDGIFRFKLDTDLFKWVNARGCKIGGDRIRKVRKSDKYISLSLFVSMVIDNSENKYDESDVTKALIDAGLMKIGNDGCVYINDSNDNATKYLHKDYSGRILVRIEKVLKLFCLLSSVDCTLFNTITL